MNAPCRPFTHPSPSSKHSNTFCFRFRNSDSCLLGIWKTHSSRHNVARSRILCFEITDDHFNEQPGRRPNSAELQISQFAAHDSQVTLGKFSQLSSRASNHESSENRVTHVVVKKKKRKKKVCLLLRATFTRATAAPFVTANELFKSKLSP